jgi:hypothetical protein
MESYIHGWKVWTVFLTDEREVCYADMKMEIYHEFYKMWGIS